MKIFEIEQMLDEEAVFSSWIDDLSLTDDQSGDVLMTLHSGRKYVISDVGEDLYNEWIDAMSKGKFWHTNIRDYYTVYRVR